MTEQKTKVVSEAQYLQALACYTVAAQHIAKFDEFRAAACEALGIETAEATMSWIADGLTSDPPRPFAEVFKKEGLVVEKGKP